MPTGPVLERRKASAGGIKNQKFCIQNHELCTKTDICYAFKWWTLYSKWSVLYQGGILSGDLDVEIITALQNGLAGNLSDSTVNYRRESCRYARTVVKIMNFVVKIMNWVDSTWWILFSTGMEPALQYHLWTILMTGHMRVETRRLEAGGTTVTQRCPSSARYKVRDSNVFRTVSTPAVFRLMFFASNAIYKKTHSHRTVLWDTDVLTTASPNLYSITVRFYKENQDSDDRKWRFWW